MNLLLLERFNVAASCCMSNLWAHFTSFFLVLALFCLLGLLFFLVSHQAKRPVPPFCCAVWFPCFWGFLLDLITALDLGTAFGWFWFGHSPGGCRLLQQSSMCSRFLHWRALGWRLPFEGLFTSLSCGESTSGALLSTASWAASDMAKSNTEVGRCYNRIKW